MVGGVDDARAHPGGAADHAVQARVADHLDDRRHAAAGLAHHPRPGAVELDLEEALEWLPSLSFRRWM